MSRYYFHLRDSDLTEDEEGMDLPGVDAARTFAMDCARDVMCADLREGWLSLDHAIEVVDEHGAHVLTMSFREAFEVRN
jgi:hypothetical protein